MNINEIVNQIRQIKEQYEAQVTGKHKQWPKAIKERIRVLAESGMRPRHIAEVTGISFHTVSENFSVLVETTKEKGV